jgi:hypothetical protein
MHRHLTQNPPELIVGDIVETAGDWKIATVDGMKNFQHLINKTKQAKRKTSAKILNDDGGKSKEVLHFLLVLLENISSYLADYTKFPNKSFKLNSKNRNSRAS